MSTTDSSIDGETRQEIKKATGWSVALGVLMVVLGILLTIQIYKSVICLLKVVLQVIL